MKRKQSTQHDKLEQAAGNIELAQHGNYGDLTKDVDKDHDEKIADALGTEADQAKRRALRQKRRELKTKKREIKKAEIENKKKEFNKSLAR